MHQRRQLSMPPFLNRAAALLTFVISALRPDIFRPSGDKTTPPSKPNKVAYINGLRGVASLVVYLSHSAGYAHSGTHAFDRAWGWNGEYYFACFPGIRIFFNGGSYAVALFFVISGYVLSRSALRMVHEKQSLRLANHLGVAIPRRFVRLFFPVWCTTFCFMVSW